MEAFILEKIRIEQLRIYMEILTTQEWAIDGGLLRVWK